MSGTPATTTSENDRFRRQQDLLPQQKLAKAAATIIGVGAIGRQVAMQLAAIGVGHLQLIDFDSVELHNVTTQGYTAEDVGHPKVEAAKCAIAAIDKAIAVEPVATRYTSRQPTLPIIFCCVDSISTRAAIWNNQQHHADFWADGRMLGEVMSVFTVTDEASRSAYSSTLFDQSDAQRGSCTSRSTIYTASIAAALMVHQFTRWIRDLPTDDSISFNLLASELTVD